MATGNAAGIRSIVHIAQIRKWAMSWTPKHPRVVLYNVGKWHTRSLNVNVKVH